MNKFNFNEKVFEINNIKLGEAMRIASNVSGASDIELAEANKALSKVFNQIATAKVLIENERKDRIHRAQEENTIFKYLDTDGDGSSILTKTVEHTSVDLAGIHKDAQAQVTATYSDPVYELLFRPTVIGSKAKAIKLAEEGRLPNASKRVVKSTVQQVELFEIVNKDKQDN